MSPIPNVLIPGVPTTGECCLCQVHKKFEGGRAVRFGNPYKCDLGLTVRGATTYELKIWSAGAPCDQNPKLIPDGSVLIARGNTIRRADGLAHFLGGFEIRDPRGVVLFVGRMEVYDRVGTHHEPYGHETCHQEEHIEGWLAGRENTPMPTSTLRALIVGSGALPKEGGKSDLRGFFNGVLIKCPSVEK